MENLPFSEKNVCNNDGSQELANHLWVVQINQIHLKIIIKPCPQSAIFFRKPNYEQAILEQGYFLEALDEDDLRQY